MGQQRVVVQAILICSALQLVNMVDSIGVEAAIGVISGVLGIVDFIKSAWEKFESQPDESKYLSKKELSEWKMQFMSDLQGIKDELRDINEENKFSDTLEEMRSSFTEIVFQFDSILDTKKRLDKDVDVTKPAYNDYFRSANDILSYYGTRSPLDKVHRIVRDPFREFSLSKPRFLEQYEKFFNVCATHVSPIQAISRLLEHIVLMSSYVFNTLMMCQYILDKLNNTLVHDDELAAQRAERIARSYTETIESLEPYLKQVSRKLYTCNLPNTTVEGSSHELKIFSKFFIRKCHDKLYAPDSDRKCSSISESELCPPGLNEKRICSVSRPCAGQMHECEDVNDLAVCVSNPPRKSRRYEYYYRPSNESAPTGGYSSCSTRNLTEEFIPRLRDGAKLLPLPFLGGPLNTKSTCNSCQCICEEREYWINTLPSYSNIDDNEVVTGAKFVIKDRILEVHIQQGKLMENGTIDTTSLEWVAPPAEKEGLMKISWNTIRSIELSTEILSPGNVVTGLRPEVRKIPMRGESRLEVLHLRVLSSPYDFKKGEIREKKYDDIAGDAGSLYPNTLTTESELSLADAESSRRGKENSKIIIKDHGFVKLTISNGKDGGQSTIPFFDGQEVTSRRPTPLSGAGFYWKGKNNTGGFVGIVLHTYDIAPFITFSDDAQ